MRRTGTKEVARGGERGERGRAVSGMLRGKAGGERGERGRAVSGMLRGKASP